MDEEKIDIAQAPSLVLSLRHGQGVGLAVIVVPQLGGDENVLALHQTLLNRPLDAVSGPLFILVVISPVKKSISDFEGLKRTGFIRDSRERQ